jgi:hypothetical protein
METMKLVSLDHEGALSSEDLDALAAISEILDGQS